MVGRVGELKPEFESLIEKHREMRKANGRPFRALSIGKGARPEPVFKELPAPPFGS